MELIQRSNSISVAGGGATGAPLVSGVVAGGDGGSDFGGEAVAVEEVGEDEEMDAEEQEDLLHAIQIQVAWMGGGCVV